MPLQNRVDPLGEIHAAPARGHMMGNRGGRFHLDDRTLGARRWRSKAWIACETRFHGRRRDVMSEGYTELFFLDEATALAAGHRPCFECRREDALAFAAAWAAGQGLGEPPRAPEMDARLHDERIDRARRPARAKRIEHGRLGDLPAGAMFGLWGETWLLAERWVLRWSFEGYDAALERRPALDAESVEILTPPSILAALAGGYRPRVWSSLF